MYKKLIIVLFAVMAVLAVFNLDRIKALFREDTRTINTQEVKLLFEVDPGLSELVDVLIAKGVVKDSKTVLEFIVENNIDTTQFAAGKYIVLSQTQLPHLVNGFIKNREGQGNNELKVNVDFNRCRDIQDIGSNISKCIKADSASIVDHILDPQTLEKYNFTAEQMPAMFLPKRYQMYYDTDAEEFVAFMANEFKQFWNDDRKSKMTSIGLTSPSKVATLASVVYAEQSKVPQEWPIIAALYLNRLDKGIRLQSDPTFKFCWGRELDGVQRLLNKHRDRDCPYNTYLYNGLPPGPINIVPADVIDAVLNPADVNYIFMCAKPDYSGEHNFTASGAQHERNAAVYRKWLAKELNN